MQEKPQGSRLALVPPNDKDAKKADKKATRKAEKKARKAAKAAAKEDTERVLKAKEQKKQEKGNDAKERAGNIKSWATVIEVFGFNNFQNHSLLQWPYDIHFPIFLNVFMWGRPHVN